MLLDCYCNTMVSLSPKILIRFTVHIPKSEITIDLNMKIFCYFQKIQTNVNRINLQCSSFAEILDMIISGPTELKTY